MRNNTSMVEEMYLKNAVRTPRIIEAFQRVDRKYFVPDAFEEEAYVDAPLPIGEEQTISQPSTVAFMLELLQPQPGNTILDIGAGSGWTTALLCSIVGTEGSVKGLERIDALVRKGKENLAKFAFGNKCTIEKASGVLGEPGRKFDRILVSASSEKVPEELFDQLNVGGVLVIPIKNTIYRFEKRTDGHIMQEAYPGFRFVPLIYK
jgi:protein-L-isoaspartate(D-aspartate) O-methyltransferase